VSGKGTGIAAPIFQQSAKIFFEEVPAAISQGGTLAEAKANLVDALKLVLQ
jgi:predicted RNase H-like HicB family nuclease